MKPPTMDWNERYAVADYIFGTAPSQFLARHEPRLGRGSRVLCIADGEGRNSVYLARLGHRVDANDLSENALIKARELAARAGVTVDFAQADLADWAWPQSAYDAACAVFVQFAYPPLRDRFFAGLKQCVRPGGLILLHGYTPEQLAYGTGGPPDAERLYTRTLLANAFADCDIEVLETYEAVLDEGTAHSGRSALIDLVARTRGAST